ncbi:hypothetical protein [Shewanella sp. 125m-1]
MLNVIDRTFSILIIFMLINSFYVIQPINSAMLAVPFAVTYSLIKGGKLNYHKFVFSRHFAYLILAILVMSTLASFISFKSSYLDLSYFKNYVSQLIQAVSIVIILICLCSGGGIKSQVDLLKIIVFCFCLQSIVQLLAFVSPDIASLVHKTYSADKISRLYEDYGGVRGLALTGAPGWGLSVGYAISFVLYFQLYVIKPKVLTVKAIFIGLLLVAGSFFAGRSALLGVIIGILMFVFCHNNFVTKNMKVLKAVLIFILLSLVFFIIFNDVVMLLVDKVFPFVFEIFYNMSQSGQASSKSTNILLKMWDIDVSYYELFWGTGIFTDPNTGEYYYGTDVGYLRELLYGGIFWLVFVLIYQMVIMGCFSFNKIEKQHLITIVFLFLMFMIMEAKAMTLGFNKYMFTMCSLIAFSSICNKRASET